ncbi:MAG: AAA family ATPase [Leptolyngbya sp.]|nr:AAA family ATPase [Candidatus Melainabacteria bacterium]
MKRNVRKGVVLGGFTPLSNASVHMIEFARNYVDELTIVVDEHDADAIPVAVRCAWLTELFPGVTVKRVKSSVWHKSDDADFSDTLAKGLRRLLPKSGGFIFCLEERGRRLAELLNAKSIPVDPSLVGMNVSEADLRKDPQAHWEALPRIVRPYFVRRVCVFGPESTGKSTLAKQLAERFGTVYVPEYAKTYIEANGKDIDDADMLAIARGQCALEDAVARDANRVLFCDSDLVTSIMWSGRLVGTVPDWLRSEADKRHYDLYLLTHYDVPWVDDVHRYIPKESPAFFDRCLLELEGRQRRFKEVKGGWDVRFQLAVSAVEQMLAESK